MCRRTRILCIRRIHSLLSMTMEHGARRVVSVELITSERPPLAGPAMIALRRASHMIDHRRIPQHLDNRLGAVQAPLNLLDQPAPPPLTILSQRLIPRSMQINHRFQEIMQTPHRRAHRHRTLLNNTIHLRVKFRVAQSQAGQLLIMTMGIRRLHRPLIRIHRLLTETFTCINNNPIISILITLLVLPIFGLEINLMDSRRCQRTLSP